MHVLRLVLFSTLDPRLSMGAFVIASNAHDFFQ